MRLHTTANRPWYSSGEDAMKKEQLPGYAMVLAVLVVGLAFAGVPVSTLLVLPLVLACPLMMFFMMRGMDHGGMTHNQRDDDHVVLRRSHGHR